MLCFVQYLYACPGFWSRHVGAITSPEVAVPIFPAEHYTLHTKPVPDLPPDTPVVRDPDNYIYFRENEGRFLAGGFEPKVCLLFSYFVIDSCALNCISLC